MRRLKKLARLNPRDWAELAWAQWTLVRAQLLVWIRPVGRLVSPIDTAASDPAPTEMDPLAERISLAVGRAAENGVFRPACLVRAIALQRMLQAHGVRNSRIRVGVRREEGQLLAHAWVEHRGRPLGEPEGYVRSFETLSDIDVVSTR